VAAELAAALEAGAVVGVLPAAPVFAVCCVISSAVDARGRRRDEERADKQPESGGGARAGRRTVSAAAANPARTGRPAGSASAGALNAGISSVW